MNQSTIPEVERGRSTGGTERALGFVILASNAQPDLVGSWLPVQRGTWIIGRGGAQSSDPYPRLPIFRQRPGANLPLGPLEGAALSRVQIIVERSALAELRVKRVGRCRMQVNGNEVEAVSIRDGDVLEIGQQLALLGVERPLRLPGSCASAPPFGKSDIDGIVGESPAIWQVREKIAFLGSRSGHLLVLGDSGVGKELVANALHRASGRRGALISRNATTFPETLLDAELFGNAEGYPNPGMRERKGLVGAADRGTLFLDEFGELPTAQQAHLLRVLDSGEYQRLGEATLRRADLRFIAATNRPVSVFRKDVLARFELTIEIPDLRSRREDIPLLIRRLLDFMVAGDESLKQQFFDSNGEPRLAAALVRSLVRDPPEGNLRGLRKALWRAIEQSTGDVLELATEACADATASKAKNGLDEVGLDANRLRIALDASGGSIEKARRELGLTSRFVLMRLMKKHGIKVHRSAASPE